MVARILFYVLAYQAALWGVLFTLRIVWHGADTPAGQMVSPQFGVAALGALFGLLIVITIDAARYLHRLVGPIYRFRKTVQAITEGDAVGRVQLRKQDFLKDFMGDFNEMLEYLETKGAIVIKDRQAAEAQIGAR